MPKINFIFNLFYSFIIWIKILNLFVWLNKKSSQHFQGCPTGCYRVLFVSFWEKEKEIKGMNTFKVLHFTIIEGTEKKKKKAAKICTKADQLVYFHFSFTFVQNCVGRLVSRHRLLAEVLVRLCQTLHLAEASVEGHRGMGWVLGHVQVSCSP